MVNSDLPCWLFFLSSYSDFLTSFWSVTSVIQHVRSEMSTWTPWARCTSHISRVTWVDWWSSNTRKYLTKTISWLWKTLPGKISFFMEKTFSYFFLSATSVKMSLMANPQNTKLGKFIPGMSKLHEYLL